MTNKPKSLLQHARDGYRLGKTDLYPLEGQRPLDERPGVPKAIWVGALWGTLFSAPFWALLLWWIFWR